MNETNENMLDNIVKFPNNNLTKIDDPLEDLLTEFDHILDDDPRLELELELENEKLSDIELLLNKAHDLSFESLEQDNSKDKIDYLTEQLETLKEVNKRLKFYLEEIDIYLP